MKYLYNSTKLYWIGVLGLIGTFFSDWKIFEYLCFFGLFVCLDIGLNFSIWRCSLLQVIGMFMIPSEFKDTIPSVDNYKSENSYCLPFKGEWVAVNGCFRQEYSHSWDIPTQRYAYDFIILDEHNQSFKGDVTNVNNYYCYGKEILAPADGVVVEIKNNGQDSIILESGKFRSKAKHIAGNYIVIQHTKNEFTTLAHLKKDSMKVEVGDSISGGQVIALCGNTGNSTEPHLHFQLQTGQSFYNSAGLPIHFDAMSVDKIADYKKYDPRPHMKFENILVGYVTRGYKFKNER